METDIFLSVGRTYNARQEELVCAIEDLLRINGMVPRTVGRNHFTSQQPLHLIAQMMDRCKGTVVVAFERVYAENAFEFRNTTDERNVENLALPTVWNQIEAAMAYIKKHPLLVIVEDGLQIEGLLEGRYDWYVQRVKVDANVVASKEFEGIFLDWKRRVMEAEKQKVMPQITFEQITVGELVKSLRLPHLWATIAALMAVLGVVATIAFTVGQAIGSG